MISPRPYFSPAVSSAKFPRMPPGRPGRVILFKDTPSAFHVLMTRDTGVNQRDRYFLIFPSGRTWKTSPLFTHGRTHVALYIFQLSTHTF